MAMDTEGKLALIDEEIRLLYEYCCSKKLTQRQIESSAYPLLNYTSVSSWKKRLHLAGIVLLVIAVIIGLMKVPQVNKLASGYAKRAAIKILPYWDWANIYNEECIINNPYFTLRKLEKEDCYLCEDLEKITEMNNMNYSHFIENYLDLDIPVIVTDAMDSWEARQKFNMHFLRDLYTHEETLNQILPCMFQSNVRARFNDLKLILRKGASGQISNFYAHWENCEVEAAKTIRQFYKRPYFLPPMVEMAKSNWIFISTHYKGKKNKPADIGFPLMLLAQVKGESKIILTPRDPCKEHCPTLYTVLKEGQILAATDIMWLLDYMPMGSAESIAIGMGGYYDNQLL